MRHAGPATAPRRAGHRQKKKQGRDAEASGQGLAYLSGELAASHGWTRSSSSPHVGKQRVIISRPAWAVAAHDHGQDACVRTTTERSCPWLPQSVAVAVP